MSGSGIITNVRLVKCPKCSRVLPELTDVPVYRCGGCGVVLQAKNRKTKIEDTNSVPSESPLAQTDELGNTSDNKESGSPSQNGNLTPTTGSSSGDQSKYSRENNATDCVTVTEGGTVSNEHCIDNEVLASDDGNSGQNEQADSACDLKGQSKDEVHTASTRKLFLGTNPPNVSSSPDKQISYGLEHQSVDSPSYISVSDSDKLPFSRKNDLTIECQSEEEVQGSQKIIFHENDASYESAGVDADELLIKRKRRPITAKGNTHFANASLPVERVYGGPESVNGRASSTFSSPASEELQSFGAKSSSPNEDDFAYGNSYSDVIRSLPIKKAEHSQTSSPNIYDGVNPVKELEVTAAAFPSSTELSCTLGKISKSATTRSGYGYDGSISSSEDQPFRDVNYVENDEKRNFNGNQVSSIMAMQQQAQEFFRSESNHKTTQESSWSPMESDEHIRHQIRNQMAMEAEIYPSGVPIATGGYANDGFTGDWDGIRSDSSIYSADKLPYTEKKRIELLKMVHELQEELSRSSASHRNVDRRNISQFENITQFSKGRQLPIHRTRRDFMDEADLQSKNSRYPFTRSEQGTNWPCQQNPWMPFSGEVINHRHHDEYYCQHRRQPVDRRFSELLAPSVCSVCSLNAGLQRLHLHPGDQFRNPYSSSNSSPRRHAESEFPSRFGDMTYDDRRLMESDFPPRVRDVTYSDQRLMERYVEASLANSSIATDHVFKDEMKIIHARETQLRVKCQIRPIAGGAPFITCYRCWSMLQLPADSFLFKRRLHKLKCGSCSKILKFSVEDRTHVVPYVHDYRAPPTSEVKGSSPVINRTSNVNISSHSHGIQMSRSDHEFGNSFSRSFSATERKQDLLAAAANATQVSDAGGRKLSSGGSSDNADGKKKRFSTPFFSKDKRPIGSPETSTNRTFNIEDYSLESKASKPRSGSPLHKLMGYTSISQVFRGPSKGTGESFRNKSTR